MAGAGYKLFNTGDVLTAAQVNTYLQEQVVMVFANSTARTTALSGVLAEGMVSYLKDTDATEVYNGSAWVGIGNSGDITAVNTNSPLTGGASSGAVTLSFDYAAGSKLTLNAQTATYTAVLADADQKLVTMSVASANDFQIPTNANVAFPVGTVINVIQIGAGQTTIKAVTSGTTTISSTGATATTPKLRAQYSAASCIKVATDTWYVVGDIA
jgi:hypothetical protein